MQLTQKETSFLKDLKEQEQICVEKYNKYASEAHDGQLKGLFAQIGQVEQQHLDTINQIMGGTVPAMQAGGNKQAQLNFTPTYNAASSDPNKQRDSYLCTDLLSTEKHVSSVYNTAVFEFKDTNIRDVLARSVQMMEHLRYAANEFGRTILTVMHDINFAAKYSDRICAMKDGRIVAFGTVEEIMDSELLTEIFETKIDIIDGPYGPIAVF